MAIINRKSGMVRGRIGDEVYSRHRGRQTVRKMPAGIAVKNTPRWLAQKATFGELAKMWRELPDKIKTLWEAYAASLGYASDVEANENVRYGYCPIQSYPPRPKNIDGFMAFKGVNARAWAGGIDIPRLYPPLGVEPSPPPGLDAKYERESGELAIGITTPTIIDAAKAEAIKAMVWITLKYEAQYLQQKHKLDVFDMPATAGARVEKRYAGLACTTKFWGYKPFNFKDLPYTRVILGAQILVSYDTQTAPEIGNGSFARLWAFNDTRYFPYEELFQSDQLRSGKIKFGEHFARYVDKLKRKLAQKEFVVHRK